MSSPVFLYCMIRVLIPVPVAYLFVPSPSEISLVTHRLGEAKL